MTGPIGLILGLDNLPAKAHHGKREVLFLAFGVGFAAEVRREP